MKDNTTYRLGSLTKIATDAVTKAQQARDAALKAAQEKPTGDNVRAFLAANETLRQTIESSNVARGLRKYMTGTVRHD